MASPYKSILLECAKAIEGGRLDVADSLLAVIQSLASKEESIWRRKVVKYFAEALVRRAYRIRPPRPLTSCLLSHPSEYMCRPSFLFAKITSKHAISAALNSGYKRLHIIDFSIVFHFWQWNDLIRDFKEQYRGLQSVLITSIAPKQSKHTDHLRKNRNFAENKDLELRQLTFNSPDDIVNCISKLRRKREDEMLVVNWDFTLHRLLAQDGAMEQVLSKLKDLGADIMVIVEQEANLNSPDLSERLEQSFQYYSPVFESLEKLYDRNEFWEMYFRRQIGNVVACEGVDRVERIESFAQWQNRLSLAGFCPVPQKADEFKEDIQRYLEDYLEGYGIEEKEGHNILLSWHGCPVAVASVWKVTDPPQFSGGYWTYMLTGLYTMQDTVDDSEGMWSSSESEDEEENDSLVCIMADRNLGSTQGSSMNRIAASAKLYDILEYICDLHRLDLAVTWISYGQDGNTNSKGKRILCIDDSAWYVNNGRVEGLVDDCYARLRLKEGKGIAGKALQSNIHIQLDIYMLDPSEFPDDSYGTSWQIKTHHAAFAIRLKSTHPFKDEYVLEFLLPARMKETSTLELLINKVLCTLQRKCLKMWAISVGEVNVMSGSEVGLDDERMPNIPHEENGYMTVNSTSNQAEETREPLEQDVQEQSAIPAPALNGENASLSEDGGLRSTSKRRKISPVWDNFVKHTAENGEVWATCKYCKKKYRAESKRGTSNFHKHLKNCSPSRQDEAEQQILVGTRDLSTSTIQRNFVFDQERGHLDIARMMIKHGYPLDMVQHEFFETFVKNLQPMFQLHSKDKVEADVLVIYRQEKEKLIRCFNNLSCLFCLTIELLSSDDRKMTYCCLTLHFIDDEWKQKKKILAFRNLQGNYDADTIQEIIRSVLIEWGIGKNLNFIWLNIAPPNDQMIGELKSKLSDQDSLLNGDECFLSSYAQIVHLLIQDGLFEIKSVLCKIRESIAYVNGTQDRREMFQKAINQLKLQDKNKASLDVPTRWDTTFSMLENALDLRNAFAYLEQTDGEFRVNPSVEEWSIATIILDCLKVLILHESVCNASTGVELYFLNVCGVYKNLIQWKRSQHVVLRSMADRMLVRFDEFGSKFCLALGILTILNPCFKLDFVEYGYSQIYGSDANLFLPRLHNDLKRVYHRYASDSSNPAASTSTLADVNCCTSFIPTSEDMLQGFRVWQKRKYESNSLDSQKVELDQYSEQPPENLSRDYNVLEWWHANAPKFPILGRMARDFFAIPVSTIVSKSSAAEEVVKMNSTFNHERPEIVEALICGRDWLEGPER
ncbi:hypothetical protein NC652_036023 [Populus alba x Populus x berolinensis]|nr:hypothetical protein NC652_036023 [Populus alba x Populus x berolinensis]